MQGGEGPQCHPYRRARGEEAQQESESVAIARGRRERMCGVVLVVYTTAADNSLNPKTHYNVSLTPSSAGALPWYQLSCSTNSGSWR